MEKLNTKVASKLIRQAIEDLEATQKKEYFKITTLGHVMIPDEDKDYLKLGPMNITRVCYVDFVGAVITNRLDPSLRNKRPNHFGVRTRQSLRALSCLHIGRYRQFSEFFYGEIVPKVVLELRELEGNKLQGHRINESIENFKKDMLKIADKLQELEESGDLPPSDTKDGPPNTIATNEAQIDATTFNPKYLASKE